MPKLNTEKKKNLFLDKFENLANKDIYLLLFYNNDKPLIANKDMANEFTIHHTILIHALLNHSIIEIFKHHKHSNKAFYLNIWQSMKLLPPSVIIKKNI